MFTLFAPVVILLEKGDDRFHCRNRLLFAHFCKGRDFHLFKHKESVEEVVHIARGRPQLLVVGPTMNSERATEVFVRSLKMENSRLQVAWFDSIGCVRPPYDHFVQKLTGSNTCDNLIPMMREFLQARARELAMR